LGDDAVLEFEVRSTAVGADGCIVSIRGELDMYTAPQLEAALGNGGRPIVDLLEVGFLDSTALGVLVASAKREREQGRWLAVVCDHRAILRVFEITGVIGLFRLYDSLEAAVEHAVGAEADRAGRR
jgi:anti-sigma B factor antagonist